MQGNGIEAKNGGRYKNTLSSGVVQINAFFSSVTAKELVGC